MKNYETNETVGDLLRTIEERDRKIEMLQAQRDLLVSASEYLLIALHGPMAKAGPALEATQKAINTAKSG